MKKNAKLLKQIALFGVMLLLLVAACACVKPRTIKIDENTVIITVNKDYYAISDTTTLKEYMDKLVEDGIFTYEIKDGMITSINGKENPADWSSCWMLYTDDTEFANNAWGILEYEGTEFGSATLGCDSLVIKDGCRYIWAYQTF